MRGFDVRLVQVGRLFDIREAIEEECVFRIERVAIHGIHSQCSVIGSPEFDENITARNTLVRR